MAKNTVTVRLPEELLEAIKAEAQSNNSTVSQVLIDAILQGRKNENAPVPQTEEAPVSAQFSEPPANEEDKQAAQVQLSVALLESLAARVYSLECFLTGSNIALGQLALTATRSAAAGQFYGLLAIQFLNDISSYLVTNEVLDTEERKRRSYEVKQRCREFQQKILNETYEQYQEISDKSELADASSENAAVAPTSAVDDPVAGESSQDIKAA
jgi:hypothetical protein